MRKLLLVLMVIGLLIASAWAINHACIGKVIDEHNGVQVHYNGWSIAQSHGKHYHADGYYYGHQWQCVEFVKRYYYLHLGHTFPDGWGHAKDFIDTTLRNGELNERRGLQQYYNCGKMPIEPNDLLVYTQGKYGHVAIVTEVGDDYVEIIQQNVFLTTRRRLRLRDGHNIDDGNNPPEGWLRLGK
ncbi:CHAP domain-containing protein [soil metagenome]